MADVKISELPAASNLTGLALAGVQDGTSKRAAASLFAAAGHTHSAMGGASSGAAGTAGFTPAPAAGDQGKFLRGDGAWANPTAAVTSVAKGTGSLGSTQTLNVANGGHQSLTVGGALTIATTGWPATGQMGELVLELINGGSALITWPNIRWVKGDGSYTTTFSSNGVLLQSSGTDWIYLWSTDGGTTIWGKVLR